jgi:selenocysteine lyase/cysteine desulfurase
MEYLGLDFMLSYRNNNNPNTAPCPPQPVAYLLEVNAPPSQDTATGLAHAEAVHDAVLRDLFTLWIQPCVLGVPPVAGDWHCVYDAAITVDTTAETTDVPHSKLALRNRFRWALYEHKHRQPSSDLPLAPLVRPHFAYHRSCHETDHSNDTIFWENGGGSQVPDQVVACMQASLHHRHRAEDGVYWKIQSRQVMSCLLGAPAPTYQISMGANATQLFARLAHLFKKHWQSSSSPSSTMSSSFDIVLSWENHQANVQPWVKLSEETGARSVWIKPGNGGDNGDSKEAWANVLSEKTRIVALTHVSNVLGVVRNLAQQIQWIRQYAPHATVVVDGVAAAPHVFANVAVTDIDWYVISCHKCFGPHLGVICGKTSAVQSLVDDPTEFSGAAGTEMEQLFETGTMNYEGCAGVVGMLDYFAAIARCSSSNAHKKRSESSQTCDATIIKDAYDGIAKAEKTLTKALWEGLSRCSQIHVVSDSTEDVEVNNRVPTVSFVHERIPSDLLVDLLSKQKIVCRHGTFLSSQTFLDNQPCRFARGFVRVSLVHYNTVEEVERFFQYCEQSIPNWFGVSVGDENIK